MKQFSKRSRTLFDSIKGNFKLSVEASFTKLNNAGGFTPLVYVSQNGVANLNPNIYLLFTYKSDEYNKGNFLYTSYPQLFRIRENMRKMADIVLADGTFIKGDDGRLRVKQELKQPIILTNIGKQNKWLSFTPVVTNTTEEGVTTAIPGVAIEFSSTGGFASVLTVEEFLTIYRIISDLNLSNLQAQRSIAYLQTEGMPIVQYPQMNNQGYQRVQYQQPSYQPQQYKPRQVYQPRQAYQQVDQQPFLYQQNHAYSKLNPVEQRQPAPQYSQPAPHIVQKQQPQQNQLPPREQEKAPIMNFSAVESTPVDYDDDAAIDAIFNGSEN